MSLLNGIISDQGVFADDRLVSEDDPWADRIDFLMEVMVSTYERRRFQTEVINELPLYPTEAILWDENQVPDVHYTGNAANVQACILMSAICNELFLYSTTEPILWGEMMFTKQVTHQTMKSASQCMLHGEVQSAIQCSECTAVLEVQC